MNFILYIWSVEVSGTTGHIELRVSGLCSLAVSLCIYIYIYIYNIFSQCAPDLTVIVAHKLHVFLLISEVSIGTRHLFFLYVYIYTYH